MDIAQLILKYSPNNAYAMIKIGNAFSELLQQQIAKTKKLDSTTPKQKALMDHLYAQNHLWFAKAEAIGWQQPTPQSEALYLQSIKQRTNLTTTQQQGN